MEEFRRRVGRRRYRGSQRGHRVAGEFSLRYTYSRYALWLAEGFFAAMTAPPLDPLIEKALGDEPSTGYSQLEGWHAGLWVSASHSKLRRRPGPMSRPRWKIQGGIGARNDLARAMVTSGRAAAGRRRPREGTQPARSG